MGTDFKRRGTHPHRCHNGDDNMPRLRLHEPQRAARFRTADDLARPRPPAPGASHSREIIILIAILTTACAFYVFTIRPGHIWGDDFAMYILQAKNFATGAPAERTGYIYNPELPQVGPPAYPPLFPFMLSLVYRLFGPDLTAMKILVIVCFMTSLFVACRICRKYLTFSSTLFILLTLVLNPYFLGLKDNIVADLPFLLVCYLALYLTDVCDRYAWKHGVYNALLAVTLYLSFAMRTIGIVLLPVAMAFAIISIRRVSPRAIWVIATAALLIAVHMLLFPAAGSYADQLRRFTVPRLLHNLAGYSWDIRHVLWNVNQPVPAFLLFSALAGLGAAGYVIRASGQISVLEIFGPLYILTIIGWASDEDFRFLVPIIPLWLFYIFVALRRLWSSQLSPVLRTSFAGLALLAVGVSYANAYSRADWGPIREGLGDPQFRQLCDYIRSSTAPGSVFIFSKPRLLALATGRKAACSAPSASEKQVSAFLDQLRANYIVLAPQFDDYAALSGFLRSNASGTRNVFRNPKFQLFVLQRPGTGSVDRLTETSTDSGRIITRERPEP